MPSGSDPVESLLHAVRNVLSPLESGLLRAAKDLESHWSASSRNEPRDIDFLARFNRPPASKKCSIDPPAAALPEGKKKGSPVVRIPIKSFLGSLLPNPSIARKDESSKRCPVERDESETCTNCLQFAVTWSLMLNNFLRAFPSPFKSVKKCFEKPSSEADGIDDIPSNPLRSRSRRKGSNSGAAAAPRGKPNFSSGKVNDGEMLSLELLLCCALDNLLRNLQMFELGWQESELKKCEPVSVQEQPAPQFDHLKIITGIIRGKKADADGLLSNIRFARVGGVPGLVGDDSQVSSEGGEDPPAGGGREETEDSSAQKIVGGILNIPLSNVERLRSTLSTVSLSELIEFIPQLGKSSSEQPEHPDKKKLFSVQDFFRYAECEGKRFFDELDRDGDGQVTLEDLEIAVGKRKLPRKYARDFLRRTKKHLFSRSIGWKQFLSLMEQKEPTILRAYTTLCLSKSGTLQKNQILTSLRSAGLPANEGNAVAMMRYLNADTGESISYSHFRNFMLLLPSDRLDDDPRSIWFEAATVVAVPPPVEISAENVLKSALAGGLASALSTSLLYPVDTIKTRVQASSLSFPEIISNLPQIGINGLYRGSIPAILGQFSSHGLRTGIFEASKLVLVKVAPTLPEIQVQSLASFCSTVLGTAVRIPCEVLKQRLQAGLFDNVGEAIVGTLHQDGIKGFFRGTGATLCREVPFYVAGMGLYAETKKATQKLLDRELEPWETIMVGALSGGLGAVITTPFDVMKTRMMTAPQGLPVSMKMVAISILRHEGPLGLFKGAVPRFFWIAPLGAMNFAGYELAKKAMVKPEDVTSDQTGDKRMAGSD